MKAPTYVPLNAAFRREEDFSSKLAENLDRLRVGKFDEGEVEAQVGTRKADIVAQGDDGILVVENQFGKADWDHWGRLEAYARLKNAQVAALVAEDFEDLMAVTCKLRNEDSGVSWYLIQVRVTDRDEFIFHIVAGPEIDIQTERSGVEYSEFWAPIRDSGLFSGKPVPEKDSWIQKSVNGIGVLLVANKHSTKVQANWPIERSEERDQYFERLEELGGEKRDTRKFALINFPLMDQGTADTDSWDAIRHALVEMGEKVFKIVAERI